MESSLRTLLRGMTAAAALASILCLRESGAVTMPNLYRVSVPPDAAAPDQRSAAIKAAMGRLLIRVTGDRNAPFDPALQSMLSDAGRYLTSYGLDRQGQAVQPPAYLGDGSGVLVGQRKVGPDGPRPLHEERNGG